MGNTHPGGRASVGLEMGRWFQSHLVGLRVPGKWQLRKWTETESSESLAHVDDLVARASQD